jgi:hypothetical protein
MPLWISNAMNKLCHGLLWFSLSSLRFSLSVFPWFSLSRLYGLAYRVTDSYAVRSAVFALLGGLMAFLTALAAVLFGVILAVLIG